MIEKPKDESLPEKVWIFCVWCNEAFQGERPPANGRIYQCPQCGKHQLTATVLFDYIGFKLVSWKVDVESLRPVRRVENG